RFFCWLGKKFSACPPVGPGLEKFKFKIQRYISQEHDDRVGDLLKELVSEKPAVAARTLSNHDSGASAWLRAVPPKPSLSMTELDFKQAIRIYCSLPVMGLPPDINCSQSVDCQRVDTPLSISHVLSCKGLAARIDRHNAVVGDVTFWLRR